MTTDQTPAEAAATAAGLPLAAARWLTGSTPDELLEDAAAFATDLGPLEPRPPEAPPGSFSGGQRGAGVTHREPTMDDRLRADLRYLRSAGPTDRDIEHEMRLREAQEPSR